MEIHAFFAEYATSVKSNGIVSEALKAEASAVLKEWNEAIKAREVSDRQVLDDTTIVSEKSSFLFRGVAVHVELELKEGVLYGIYKVPVTGKALTDFRTNHEHIIAAEILAATSIDPQWSLKLKELRKEFVKGKAEEQKKKLETALTQNDRNAIVSWCSKNKGYGNKHWGPDLVSFIASYQPINVLSLGHDDIGEELVKFRKLFYQISSQLLKESSDGHVPRTMLDVLLQRGKFNAKLSKIYGEGNENVYGKVCVMINNLLQEIMTSKMTTEIKLKQFIFTLEALVAMVGKVDKLDAKCVPAFSMDIALEAKEIRQTAKPVNIQNKGFAVFSSSLKHGNGINSGAFDCLDALKQ